MDEDSVKKFKILVINPGSTSTRTAIFESETLFADEKLDCPSEELGKLKKVIDQVPMRTRHIEGFLKRLDIKVSSLDAIATRGGPLRPVAGGVYSVNEKMLTDASSEEFIEHVSKIACVIAVKIGKSTGVPSFIVDPVSTDEYLPISRVSGLKEVPRKSMTHALNMKAVARYHAREIGKPYEELNLITVQLGGGCSVAVHDHGRMIDSFDANGEGPFSPERSGGLRADDLARFVLDSGKDFREIRKKLAGGGGLMSLLGTADAREVEKRIANGDKEAKLCYEAMAYSTAKSICALAASVNGKLDAVILTGGLAMSKVFTDWIVDRIKFLCEVRIIPGEHEMRALAEGAMRVLNGEEKAKTY